MIQLNLPEAHQTVLWFNCLPPSDNRRKRWLTKEEREFYALVATVAKTFKVPCYTGRVFVDIAPVFPDRRRRDANNLIKSLMDSLQFAGIVKDDSQCLARVLYAYVRDEVADLPKEMRDGGIWVRISPVPSDTSTSITSLLKKTWHK